MAVLAADKRAASAICKSLCVLQVLQGDVFNHILADYPEDQSRFHTHSLKRLVGLSRGSHLRDLNELDKLYGRVHPNLSILKEQQRADSRTQQKQMPTMASEDRAPKPRLSQIGYMALQ